MTKREKMIFKRDPRKTKMAKDEVSHLIRQSIRRGEFLTGLYLMFKKNRIVWLMLDEKRSTESNASLFKYTMH